MKHHPNTCNCQNCRQEALEINLEATGLLLEAAVKQLKTTREKLSVLSGEIEKCLLDLGEL